MRKPPNVKELANVGVFTALMVVFAQIAIPLPITPVPLTLSVFAVCLSATILPLRSAVMVQVAYLLLGAVGVPVFAGFRGGISVIAGPTGGYIIGYAFMAAAIGLIAPRIANVSRIPGGNAGTCIAYGVAYALGLMLLYLFGTVWMMAIWQYPFGQTLTLTVVPFLPLDFVKIVVCAAIAPALRKALAKSVASI